MRYQFIFHNLLLRSAFLFILYILCLSIPVNSFVFQPTEDTSLIQTPGAGFQTMFGRYLPNDPTVAEAGLVSGSAYDRFTWADLEPQEGQYNFDWIDDCLARAKAGGQTFEFRIMLSCPGCGAELYIPQWLVDKGGKVRYSFCETNYYSPDLDDSIIRIYHDKLIRAFGARYDDHPDLGSVDIGSVGMWGEWHEYCVPENMPSIATRKAIIDLYHEAFPHTPLVMNIDDSASLVYSASKGRTAWRADCWGDYGPTGWHHHQMRYWPNSNTIKDAWKNGPVALEPCGVMGTWETAYLTDIVNDAIAWHTSLFQNKGESVPVNVRPEMLRLAKQAGFKLVLNSLTWPDVVNTGSTIKVAFSWINKGIAPPYRDFRIAMRLRDNQNIIKAQIITDQTVKGFLPGDTTVTVSYPIPSNISSGDYKLETGLVYHNAADRILPIAISGKTSDKWYLLGNVTLTPGVGIEKESRHEVIGAGVKFKIRQTGNMIRFEVKNDLVGNGTITLYSLRGEKLKQILISNPSISWDLKYDKSKKVTSGIYFAVLDYGKERFVKKCIISP